MSSYIFLKWQDFYIPNLCKSQIVASGLGQGRSFPQFSCTCIISLHIRLPTQQAKAGNQILVPHHITIANMAT